METIAASICDRVQSKGCFIVMIDGGKIESIIHAGDKKSWQVRQWIQKL